LAIAAELSLLYYCRGSAQEAAGGAYSATPDPLAGGDGDWLPLPLLSALRASSFLFPHSKIVPVSAPPHLMQAGDAPEFHIGYD